MARLLRWAIPDSAVWGAEDERRVRNEHLFAWLDWQVFVINRSVARIDQVIEDLVARHPHLRAYL